jgi:hypothetical protein
VSAFRVPGSSKVFSRCCEGDDVIYPVSPPRDNAPQSLARVIHPDQRVRRALVDGLDVEPLRPTSPPWKTPRCRVLGSHGGTRMKPPSQPIRFSRYRSVTCLAGMPRPTGGRRAAERPTRAPARRAALYRPLPDHLDLRRRSRSTLDRRCAVDRSARLPHLAGSRTPQEPHDDLRADSL